jgi:endonuclease-3
MDKAPKGELVLRRLEVLYGDVHLDDHYWKQLHDPFWLIVETILSQNTSEANSKSAFRRLVTKYRTIEELAGANTSQVALQIKQAGLYEAKAGSLVTLAQQIKEEFDGDTWLLLAGSYQSARNRLLKIKGIGNKTADVVLLFARGFDVIPVDTHIFRVSRRIGIAPQKGDYDKVKQALEREIPPGKRKYVHIALIRFGREICRARIPEHWRCPLTDICDYFEKVTRGNL